MIFYVCCEEVVIWKKKEKKESFLKRKFIIANRGYKNGNLYGLISGISYTRVEDFRSSR